MTNANPGVVTWYAHGRSTGDPIVFETTGALPTNVTAGTTYYVLGDGNLTVNTFDFSATVGGTPIDTTAGTQSGNQTAYSTTPTLNTALVNAAALYAKGDSASISTALNWAANDMWDGQRLATNGANADLNMVNYLNTWLPQNIGLCATVGYPPLQFVSYEGGFETQQLGSINGLTLGLTSAQITQVSTFYFAFKNSDQFRNIMNQFYNAFSILSS